MTFRDWDAGTASAEEVAALLAMLNAAFAVDLPGDPQWRNVLFREYVTQVMPGQSRRSWLAEQATGTGSELVGYASILGLGDTGVIEVLVHPRHRRGDSGHALLAHAAGWAFEHGYSSLGVEVPGGTPAVDFYDRMGFTRVYQEIRTVLKLDKVNWPALTEMAAGVGSGYRVQYHAGGPPQELMASYAHAKAEPGRAHEAPVDAAMVSASFDPARLRDSLSCLRRRGLEPHIVVAIHERSGEVAGLTEVVVPAQRPTRADQYDTIVVPDHHGYGIDRAIKARMLLELRRAAPGLREVQTWNAPDDKAIRKINTELGFRQELPWWEFEADVADLVERLR